MGSKTASRAATPPPSTAQLPQQRKTEGGERLQIKLRRWHFSASSCFNEHRIHQLHCSLALPLIAKGEESLPLQEQKQIAGQGFTRGQAPALSNTN